MGAVHGVYLKYVGLSAASYAGYSYLVANGDVADLMMKSGGFRNLLTTTVSNGSITGFELSPSILKLGAAAILKYSSMLNGLIAILFKLEVGMGMIGKDSQTGQIPFWSYLLYFPFHLPSILYTRVHGNNDRKKKVVVPVASEVQPGWWVGGTYSKQLDKDWGGIVDLTVEFTEGCFDRSKSYHLCASWDGVPPTPEKMEEAANYAVEARKKGDVLIHCAHGRGRSTTLMCAALVKAGLFDTWEDAFEKGIKPGRSVCKLNRRMKEALTTWQSIYIDSKKSN